MTRSIVPVHVQLYTPHPGQLVLHNCPVRFRVMACGRRFGKTLAATNELAKKALEKPSSLNWWIAPTYRQTEIAFDLLCTALQPVLSEPPNKSKMRLKIINNAVIECRSAERYENMRGDGPSFAVFDEASKCPKEAWTEVVRPALSDNQGGAIFISTPWGHDWFWELFVAGDPNGANHDPEWWSQSFPTSANPFIPAKEIESARKSLPMAVFEQEYMAHFNDDASSVFRGVDNCKRIGGFIEPKKGHYYVVGWDVARYRDYSVFTVVDCSTRDVVFWKRFNGLEYRDQIDNHLVPLVRQYNNAHVVMDSTGIGNPLPDEVRLRDVSCEAVYFTNASKKNVIDRAVVAIEQRQITYPDIPDLIHELKAYGYEFTASRNIIYNAPKGQHDDCVISLALAIQGAKLGGEIPMLLTNRPDPLVQHTEEMVQRHDVDELENAAFIQERQEQMMRSLRMVGSHAAYHAPAPIRNDSEWGIA